MHDPSSERFQRLDALFHEAIGLAPGERDAFITAISGTDTVLREDLQRLLAADSDVQREPSSAPFTLPRFGNYQARELIGSGGMGAIYLATREDGEVRQKVAIKAIASAFVSPLLEDRLRRERQILAELHHPNIAAFLDGGVTADGFPYLVMEFIDGQRIDSWCDARKRSITDRLHLFQKVCAAVSFAHQHLVIHRDLKPGNILVTAEGEPKLLDFGIAKTLSAEATQATVAFMTPLYSSPEVLRNQPATVAADVYSLGVVLYELLSGSHPFAAPSATHAELVERVTTSDAAPISKAGDPAAAAKRGETRAGLSRRLSGDLDAIAFKAMAKNPADRYASVEQLSEDIRRHLSGHAVLAVAPGVWYRTRKFVARRKSAVIGGALIAISLLGGLIATLWQKRQADQRFADAHELARYLVFDLPRSVGKLSGSTALKAEIVERSMRYLDRLSAARIRDPILRTEVGESYAELGMVLGSPFQANLGQPAKARESDRKAIAILDPIVASDPDNRHARVILTRTRLELGRLIVFTGQAAEGRALIEQSTRESAALAQRWPSDFDVRLIAAYAFDTLARVVSQDNGYINAQGLDQAMDALRTGIDHARNADELRPANFEALRQLAMSYKQLGDLTELRDRAAATAIFRQGLAALDRIAPQDMDTPEGRTARSSILLGLGWNLGNLGQFAPALAALEEARDLRDRAAAEDPNNVMAAYFRTIPYRDLGIVSGFAGRDADKLRYFLTAIGIYDQLLTRNPSNQSYRTGRAELQADAANLSFGFGRREDATRLAQDGIAVLKTTAVRPNASPIDLALAAMALMDTKIASLSDPKLALVFLKRAADLSPDDSEILGDLAKAYAMNRDLPSAAQAIEKALSHMSASETPDRAALEKSLARYRTGKP